MFNVRGMDMTKKLRILTLFRVGIAERTGDGNEAVWFPTDVFHSTELPCGTSQ